MMRYYQFGPFSVSFNRKQITFQWRWTRDFNSALVEIPGFGFNLNLISKPYYWIYLKAGYQKDDHYVKSFHRPIKDISFE